MKSGLSEQLEFSKELIPYEKTSFFTKIVLDYLSGQADLRPFYGRLPEINSFKDQIDEKSASYEHRSTLVAALKEQYDKGGIKSGNISNLESSKAYTITTGHQVCLFTGPLYFIYKIVTAINLCKALKENYPDYDFVPVFWMATEDHDFEEANHFYLHSGKLEWESGQGGAVGRMKTTGLEEVSAQLRNMLGLGYTSGELISLFDSAYLKHTNIADATRYLVHQLFGAYGVVVIDGDDANLKSLMVPAFGKELLHQVSNLAIEDTGKKLTEKYKLQVKQREINLFYLGEELRERIVMAENGRYEVLNTNINFDETELKEMLKSHPERFSPNVVLRPLYQETVLPNLAYVGGGGELAYWFQLKKMFKDFDTPFPILVLRNSVMLISEKVSGLLTKIGLEPSEIFRPEIELENELVRGKSPVDLNLDDARQRLESIFLDMEARLRKVDLKLEKSVRSGYARTDRIVDNLEKKMLRAERKKQDILIGRFEAIRNELLPREGLQERNINFAAFYLAWGDGLIEGLIKHVVALEKGMTVIGLSKLT